MTHMTFASARVLLMRLQAEETRLAVDLTNDPKWLVLPLAQRNELLLRHSVFERYHALTRPSAADAEKCAAEAGMKLRNFYRVYKAWASAGRTPLDLIPYKGLRGERKSKLANPEIAEAIRKLVDTVLNKDPVAPPRKVIRYVKDNWSRPEKLPSDVTLRNFHDKAVRDRKVQPGSLTISFSNMPQEEVVHASTFGEVLIVDHTAPAKVLINGEPASTPTITLAIDLWSGLPLGVAVSAEAPSTSVAIDALWDAQRRLKVLVKTTETIKPRILYASTFERSWDDFRNWFLKHDYDLIERRDVHLHHGGPTKRIVGSKLGGLSLQPKLAGRQPGAGHTIDIDTTALLTLQQVHHVVDVAIEGMLQHGLDDLGTGTGKLIDLPPRRPKLARGEGAPPVRREATVKIADILNRIRQVVGEHLVATEMLEVDREKREYRIRVCINDQAHRAQTWLDLAAEAIALHKNKGVAIQFDVTTHQPANHAAVELQGLQGDRLT